MSSVQRAEWRVLLKTAKKQPKKKKKGAQE
jgi:hypothetical protein